MLPSFLLEKIIVNIANIVNRLYIDIWCFNDSYPQNIPIPFVCLIRFLAHELKNNSKQLFIYWNSDRKVITYGNKKYIYTSNQNHQTPTLASSNSSLSSDPISKTHPPQSNLNQNYNKHKTNSKTKLKSNLNFLKTITTIIITIIKSQTHFKKQI